MAYEMGWDLCPATSPISPPTSLPCHGRHVAFFPFLKYAKLVPVSGPLHTRLPLIGTPRSSCGGLLPIPWASAQMSPPRGGGPSVITPSKRALHPPSLCTVSIPLGFCHSRFLVSVLIVKHQERRSLFGSFMAVEQGLVHSRGSVGNLCLSLLMGHLRPLVLPLFRSIFHTTVGLSF